MMLYAILAMEYSRVLDVCTGIPNPSILLTGASLAASHATGIPYISKRITR
jgi:hypothetical protein